MKITQRESVMPFCRHLGFWLSSAYTVRSNFVGKWVRTSPLTTKCHMTVLMRRSGRKRRWAVMKTETVDLDFQLQLEGHLAFTWCKYFVYIRLSVKSDISLSSRYKLQYYAIGTDNYACYFSFQARTIWSEGLHKGNWQKWVNKRNWPLNLVLWFMSSSSVWHRLCSWQLG